MDVAAASTILATGQVKQQAGILLVKKVMDVSNIQNDNMIKMMEKSVTPHKGTSIDIRL
jgi:hypothetical protein